MLLTLLCCGDGGVKCRQREKLGVSASPSSRAERLHQAAGGASTLVIAPWLLRRAPGSAGEGSAPPPPPQPPPVLGDGQEGRASLCTQTGRAEHG